MKIAVIGTGISGLVCAHLLARRHELTVYEAASYIGGHTNTIQVKDADQTLPIDTGFIVFNKKTYPNFVQLIEKLGVAYQNTSMSFSVKCEETGLEYNGTNLNSLFAQRSNVFNLRFLRMLAGIIRFNKAAKKFIADNNNETTLRDFVKHAQLNDEVVRYYIVPMAASVWSADPEQMWDFPALFLLRFWQNHGFLEINERPQWCVIKGGSNSYIGPLTRSFSDRILLNTPVTKVRRTIDKVFITAAGRSEEQFDAVVFANHSDQALALLTDPAPEEHELLSAFPYQYNKAVLHTESAVLPRKKLAWAAWNYHLTKSKSGVAVLTYNMNILQSLKTQTIYNVTLNPPWPIAAEKVIKVIDYHHPVFTLAGMKAQSHYPNIMGHKQTFFCGAYLRNGFHEDGVVTALNVCKHFGESL